MRQILLTLTLFLISFYGIGQNIIPTDIPDLLAWYDAQDTSLEIGSVGTWFDKSENENNLIQASSSRRPILVDNVINGKRAVKFNGANQFMTVNFGEEIHNPGTFFIVFNNDGENPQWFMDNISTGNRNVISLASPNIYLMTSSTTTSISYPKEFPMSFQISTFIVNSTSSKIRENGIDMVTGNLTNNSFEGLRIGSRNTNTLWYNGYAAEIIYYNRALSEQEVIQIENYLNLKYGGKVSLGENITQYGFCDTTIYATGGDFSSYLWSDGSTADSLVVTKSGTYWCEVINRFGTASVDTIQVNFSPFQYPDFSMFCPSSSKVWNTNLNQNDFTFEWMNNSSSNQMTIATEQDVWVKVTDTLGCTFYSDTIHFYEDPFSSLVSLGGDLDLCYGNTLQLVYGAEEAISYSWIAPEGEQGNGATTPSIPINSSGTYAVTVTNANNCIAYDEIEINILGDAPIIQIEIPEHSCVNATFSFEDQSYSVDDSTVDSWTWVINNNEVITTQQGESSLNNEGFFPIHLTVGTSVGCYTDTTFTIEVKSNPILGFTTQNQCQGDEIFFYGDQITPTPISSWEWNFDDPESGTDNTSSNQNTSHIFTTGGEHNVSLIGIDIYGCVDTLIQLFNVNSTPNVGFDYEDICAGNVAHFINTTTMDTEGNTVSYQWDFGDGTTSGQTNPDKPYVAQGEYWITLNATASNGCSNTLTQLLKVHALPQIDYIIEQACAGIPTSFNDNSFVSNGSIADVKWSFNNAPPISGFTIEKNFENGGTYNLRQTVKSAFGCNNSNETSFEIFDKIKADFVYSPNLFAVNEPVHFQSTSIGAEFYEWTFGDFATSQEPDTTIIFTENQIGENISVQLKVSNSHECEHHTSKTDIVIGRDTDLELAELFLSEQNGFISYGVRLKNNGFTPINKIELTLERAGKGSFKEIWEGVLEPGENKIYTLSTQPSSGHPLVFDKHDFICINAKIIDGIFQEENLSNNVICRALSDEKVVMILPYPNPFTEKLNLRLIATEPSYLDNLYIYDYLGREVYQLENINLDKGENSIEI